LLHPSTPTASGRAAYLVRETKLAMAQAIAATTIASEKQSGLPAQVSNQATTRFRQTGRKWWSFNAMRT